MPRSTSVFAQAYQAHLNNSAVNEHVITQSSHNPRLSCPDVILKERKALFNSVSWKRSSALYFISC